MSVSHKGGILEIRYTELFIANHNHCVSWLSEGPSDASLLISYHTWWDWRTDMSLWNFHLFNWEENAYGFHSIVGLNINIFWESNLSSYDKFEHSVYCFMVYFDCASKCMFSWDGVMKTDFELPDWFTLLCFGILQYTLVYFGIL